MKAKENHSRKIRGKTLRKNWRDQREKILEKRRNEWNKVEGKQRKIVLKKFKGKTKWKKWINEGGKLNQSKEKEEIKENKLMENEVKKQLKGKTKNFVNFQSLFFQNLH